MRVTQDHAALHPVMLRTSIENEKQLLNVYNYLRTQAALTPY